MILEKVTSIYIEDLDIKEDLSKLLSPYFNIIDTKEDSHFLVTKTFDNQYQGIQLVLDESNVFKESSHNTIFVQPFLNGKEGQVEDIPLSIRNFIWNISNVLDYPIKTDKRILVLC